jgi:DNA-binding CsgD family transcriptional regulator
VQRSRTTRRSTGAPSLALAQRVLDAIPFPTFGCTRDFQFEWANAAARTYFGLGEQALAELGRRAPGPRQREFHDRHFRAWASGEPPHPVRFHWEGATGKGDFLLIPFPMPAITRAAFAFMLIPRDLLDAALSGEPVDAASQLRRWMDVLVAAAETRREPERDERFARLTPREWEIARRIAAGDRVLLLAELLHISPNTVRNHLKSIFRKVGVHSQTQLVKSVRELAPPPVHEAERVDSLTVRASHGSSVRERQSLAGDPPRSMWER